MTSSSSPRKQGRFLTAEAMGPREEQQDASLVLHTDDLQAALLIVSDGVGGNSGGRLASQAVVDTAKQAWLEHRGNLSDPIKELKALCNLAHDRINAEGERHQVSPRATIAALYLMPTRAYWIHSGDSRVYHFRAGKLVQRTEDHSLLQVLLKQGLVKEEQMGSHPDQGLLIQALGGDEYRTPSVGSIDTNATDAFLLCTDGFWERIKVEEMAQFLFTNRTQPHLRLEELVGLAVQRNGPGGDNVTAAAALPESGSGDTRIISRETRHGSHWLAKLPIVLIPVCLLAIGFGALYRYGTSSTSIGSSQNSDPARTATPVPTANQIQATSPARSASPEPTAARPRPEETPLLDDPNAKWSQPPNQSGGLTPAEHPSPRTTPASGATPQGSAIPAEAVLHSPSPPATLIPESPLSPFKDLTTSPSQTSHH